MNTRKEKTKPEDISNFLTKTGFVFEMEVSEHLKKSGYKIFPNRQFLDYDEDKKREIDIIALKKINGIDVVLIIECKQSSSLDWIFICSDKSPNRYYKFIKHLPNLQSAQAGENKLFNGLRPLDDKIPLAQNSIIRHMSGKEQDSREIYECITRLPKALIGAAEIGRFDKKDRVLLFPVAIFSGQIFIAEYGDTLSVREVDSVQYATEINSKPYQFEPVENSFVDDRKIINNPAAKINSKFGSKYLIEFISKIGLDSFLFDLEKRVSKIDIDLWPIE